MAAFVKANFADAALAGFDQATMATGITFQRAPFQMLGHLGRAFGGQ